MKKPEVHKERKNMEQFLRRPVSMAVLFLSIVMAFLYSYDKIFDKKLDSNGDNIYYFTCAKALAEGDGYSTIIGTAVKPHTHFPPGYPLFVSSILKISPDNILAVKKANGALLCLSLLLFFLIMRKCTQNTVIAFATVMVCCFQQNLLRFSTIMMSEMLFIFLGMAAFYCLLTVAGKKFMPSKISYSLLVLALLFCVSYAFLTRTIGMTLVLSVILWLGLHFLRSIVLWLRARKRNDGLANEHRAFTVQHIVLCIMVADAFLATRQVWNARQERCGVVANTYSADFMKKQNGGKMAGWDDWKTRLKSNVRANIARWPAEIVFQKEHADDPTPKDWAGGIMLTALMLCGIAGMKRGNLLIMFYVLGTVCVMLLYYEEYQGPRYLMPVIPFYIFLTVNGAATVIRWIVQIIGKHAKTAVRPYGFEVAMTIIMMLILIPLHSESLKQQEKSAKIKSWKKSSAGADVNYANFMEAIEWCGDSLPGSARVVCRKPELFYMYSGFHKCDGFPQYCEVDSMYRKLVRDSTEYLIIDNWFRHAYTTLYPVVRKYPEKFMKLQEFGKLDTVLDVNPCYVLRFNDQWGYHGDRVDGKKEGKGYELFQNGRKYVGEFHNNAVNGYGELYDSTGALLAKGYWRDGTLIKAR